MRRHTAAIWCSVICESGTSNESCQGTRPLASDHFLLLNYPRPLTQGRPDLAGSRSARNLFAQQQFHLLNVWKGSKAELGKVRLMSAFPPKADSCSAAIHHLLGQVLPNFGQQLARAERFWHVVIAARRSRLLFFAAKHIGGYRNDRDRSQLRIGL